MVFTFFPRDAKRKPPFFTIFLSRLSPSVMKAVGNKAIAQFSLDHPMAGWTRPCRALRAARKPPGWARGRSRGVRDLVGRWVNADVANGHWFGSKEVDFLGELRAILIHPEKTFGVRLVCVLRTTKGPPKQHSPMGYGAHKTGIPERVGYVLIYGDENMAQ